jgi:hypothetical protein
MKANISDIRIQELKEGGSGGGPSGEDGGAGDFAPPGKPENVDEWGDDEESKERDSDGIPEESPNDGSDTDDDYESNPINPGEILRPGELGEGDSTGGKSEGDLEAEWEAAVKRSLGAGKVPSGVSRALKKLNEPVIDWKSELSRYIDDMVSKTKYKLPARRFIGGGDAQYGYKRYKEDFESVVVAIDTSGSITQPMIEQFLSEVKKITEEYNPEKTVILYCDTKVYAPDILEPGDSPDFSKIKGGGGTEFEPPFAWVQENMIQNGEVPTVFIYFTDGEATFPDSSDYDIDSYADKCIWTFLTFNGEKYGRDQPFGERIDITLSNKNIKAI